MGKPKISDQQIIAAIKSLEEKRRKQWYYRFGQEAKPFLGFRREIIQNEIADLFNITMSPGGFRSRLKRMITPEGNIEQFRMYERVVFYSMTGR